MPLLSSQARYGSVAQWFHWFTLVLVAASYVTGLEGSEERIYAPRSDLDRLIHETFGVLVLGVTVLRLCWLAFDRRPDMTPMPEWMKRLGRYAHWALYFLLFAVPLTAIEGAWLEGHSLRIFGFGEIGPLWFQSRSLGQFASESHTVLANLILWLAGLHAAAALLHHFVLKDRTLVSMVPWLARHPQGSQSKASRR